MLDIYLLFSGCCVGIFWLVWFFCLLILEWLVFGVFGRGLVLVG